MAEYYAHESLGKLSCLGSNSEEVRVQVAQKFGDDMADWGRVVPLQLETASTRHADDLCQVLKDLTGMAKLAASHLNSYHAAIRNAEELLNLIDNESKKEASNV